MAFYKGGNEIITLTDNHYTLVDIKSYTETDQYTTTSSTNQFTCTDQSLNFTTTAQTNGADLITLHGSLNAHSNADNNGYNIYMKRIRAREQQGDQIRSAVKEINTLKKELREIKGLIKELVNGS